MDGLGQQGTTSKTNTVAWMSEWSGLGQQGSTPKTNTVAWMSE